MFVVSFVCFLLFLVFTVGKSSVDEVSFDNVVTYVIDQCLVFVMPDMIVFGYLNEIFTMQGCAEVGCLISFVVALQLDLGGDAIVDMFVGGMSFHPGEFNGLYS